jgi:hypothetical protein
MREKLLAQYWSAWAEYGPFEVSPQEFVNSCMREYYAKSASQQETNPSSN